MAHPPPPNAGPSTSYYAPYSYPYPPHSPAPYPYPPYSQPQPHPGRRPNRAKPRRGYSNGSSPHYSHLPHGQYLHPSPSSYNQPLPHPSYHPHYIPQTFIPVYAPPWSPHHPPQSPLPDSPYSSSPSSALEQPLEHPLPAEQHPADFIEPTTPKLSPIPAHSNDTLNDPEPSSPHIEPPPPSPPPESTPDDPTPPRQSDLGGWAIWSRRPHDPSLAPGIIISPRANPPSHIRQSALDSSTPPASPIRSSPLALPSSLASEPAVVVAVPEKTLLVPEEVSAASSSATETTPTTTRPGSPASSHTSISASHSPAKNTDTTLSDPIVPSSTEQSTLDPPSADVPPKTPTEGTITQPSQPAPSIAPAPLKKSWASLLRPSTGSSSVTSKLPTSPVVGISIPADTPPQPANHPLSNSGKTALLSLLLGRRPGSTAPVAGYASAAAAPPQAPVVPPTVDMHKVRPRGLVNSGNMCFANSVLQVLVYCLPFHSFFLELGRLLPTDLSSLPDSGADGDSIPLVRATIEFLKEFLQKLNVREKAVKSKGKERDVSRLSDHDDEDDWELRSFLPCGVYDAMKEKKRFDTMKSGQQEDAEEFFGFYLDVLEEELTTLANLLSPPTTQPRELKSPSAVTTAVEESSPAEEGWLEVGKRNRTVITRTIKSTESAITKIFGGKFRSTLKAPGQKDSVIVEDWRSLRLDIQRDQVVTIQDALAHITHPQAIQMAHPTRHGVMIDASQQVLIESLPPVLVLHLKRFCYDVNVGGAVKVNKHVRYGPEIDIGGDLMAANVRRPGHTKYKLFGVVYHHGISAGGGHYTLDVLHPSRYDQGKEGWVRIDDELVSDVRKEDVYGVSDKDDTRCAYLLFYRKVAPFGK